jgi:hypothetical protein
MNTSTTTVKHSAWRGISAGISFVVGLLLVHFASTLNLTLADVLNYFPQVANITVGTIVYAVWHYAEKNLLDLPVEQQ